MINKRIIFCDCEDETAIETFVNQNGFITIKIGDLNSFGIECIWLDRDTASAFLDELKIQIDLMD